MVASYTGSTTNFEASPANNAALIKLDADLFTVTSVQNQASVQIGVNFAEQIRIYGNRANGDGNLFELSIASGYVITKIEIEFLDHGSLPTAELILGTASENLTAAQLVNTTLVRDNLGISSFSLQNTFNDPSASGNAQIWIKSISITYASTSVAE